MRTALLLSLSLLAQVAHAAEPTFKCSFSKTGYEQKMTDGMHMVSTITGKESTNEVEVTSQGISTVLSFSPDAAYGAIPGNRGPAHVAIMAKSSGNLMVAKGLSSFLPSKLQVTLNDQKTEATETIYLDKESNLILQLHCKRN